MDFILKKIFLGLQITKEADHYTESKWIHLPVHKTLSKSFILQIHPTHQCFHYNALKVTIPLFQIILHVILKIDFKYQILGF